jgi:hypothetical protein
MISRYISKKEGAVHWRVPKMGCGRVMIALVSRLTDDDEECTPTEHAHQFNSEANSYGRHTGPELIISLSITDIDEK